MPRPKKYPDELRERAVRLVFDHATKATMSLVANLSACLEVTPTRPTRRALLAAAGVAITLLTLLASPSARAASSCPPLSVSDSYASRVNDALRSTQDLWGNEVLAQPGGPTYDSIKDYLKPLMLGGLTDSGTHYLPFGQPQGSISAENALHEADGSKFYSNTPQDNNPNLLSNSLTVKVGSAGDERYGSCHSRLGEPTLRDGYPILQTEYVDADGLRYSQESFAARAPEVPQSDGYGNLVSWIRLTVERGSSAASRVTLNFEPKSPGLFQSGNQLLGSSPYGLRTYLGFSPGATYDAVSRSLRYSIDLSTGGPRTVYLVRLNQPNTLNSPIVPSAASYSAAQSATRSYWEGRLRQGATFSVPEPRVAQAQRNLLIQNITMGKNYSIGNNYQYTYPEQYDVIRTLGEYGFSGEERVLLEELMDWTENGRQGFDGLFKGYKLLSAAGYFKRTRDVAFLDKYTPRFVEWAEDFKAQIAADPHGLLQQERWAGDVGGPCYALSYNQSFGFAGLRDIVNAWAMSGRDDLALRYGPVVTGLRRSLRTAIERSEVRLPDGSLFVPACLLQDVQPYDAITATEIGGYWNLVMPRPFSSGLFEPRSSETNAILCYLSNHGSRLLGMIRFNREGRAVGSSDPSGPSGYRSSGTDPVYNYGLADLFAQNDEPDQLVLSLYGLLAHAISRGTYIGGEGETVGVVPGEYYRSMNNPPNSVTNAAILNTLRVMLVHETKAVSGRGDGLHLAYSTPRGWLETGKRIAVSNAPTEFGPVDYTLERLAADPRTVHAEIEVPSRLADNRLSLRLRVPGDLTMSDVTVNGQRYTRFDAAAETVNLTGLSGSLTIRIQYEEAPGVDPPRMTSSCGSTGPSPAGDSVPSSPGESAGAATGASEDPETALLPRAREGERAPRARCFPRTVPVGAGSIGGAAVGMRDATVLKRLGRPSFRRGNVWRYCVRGGGKVLIVFSRRKRVILVASTGRRHTRREVGPGATVRRLRAVFRSAGVRTVPGGILMPRSGSSRQVLFGTRRGRVRYVAIADRGTLKKRSQILQAQRQAGLA